MAERLKEEEKSDKLNEEILRLINPSALCLFSIYQMGDWEKSGTMDQRAERRKAERRKEEESAEKLNTEIPG
jgi:cytochrome c-type biogenesis protein CcmH/NrfG